MGNLGSVRRAVIKIGGQPIIIEHPEELKNADRVILPGVGSFAEGMRNLSAGGWVQELHEYKERGRPMLGICLGMQLLAGFGHEGGGCTGLSLIEGEVKKINPTNLGIRVPHCGWNNIKIHGKSEELLCNIPSETDFYFSHSYAFFTQKDDNVLATVDYGGEINAIISEGSVFGTQFHPEKSSKLGLRLLQNFLEIKSC